MCEDARRYGDEVPGGENEAIETSDNGFRDVQIRIFAKISMFPCTRQMRKEARLIELLIAEGCKCSLGPKSGLFVGRLIVKLFFPQEITANRRARYVCSCKLDDVSQY